MRSRRLVSYIAAALVTAGAGPADERPVTVSPGHSARLVQVERRCPTFLWGSVPGARSYELVVYALSEEGSAEEAEPVVSATVPGSAQGWTPSLEQCLQRGGRYAWSVRAVGEETTSRWSVPSLFLVAAVSSEAKFEAALQLVQEFLGSQAGAETRGAAATEAAADSGPGLAPRASSPAPAAMGMTQLNVDGGVVATSFTGDGSTLTSLDPANLAGAVAVDKGGTGATDAAGARANLGVAPGPHVVDTDTTCDGAACDGSSFTEVDATTLDGLDSTAFLIPSAVDCQSGGRYEDNGDGTVTDCRSGIIWLRDASCDTLGPNGDGTGMWQEAVDAVAVLASGACGLTDGSQAGFWRFPKITEWMAMVASARRLEMTAPSLMDAEGTSQWTTDGDAFVGVESLSYWSEDTGESVQTWIMSLNSGGVGADDRSSTNAIWPVRAISEIDTSCLGNAAPVADAGEDGFADGGELWTLDGLGSQDSDGDPLTYWWQQIAGPIIELNGPATAQPTFVAPPEGGEVLVRLTVDDGCRTDTDEVVVTVNPAPVCGNGIVEGSETCDDGATNECGPCNATCSGPGSGSTCGDGILCPETEFCDDGSTDECGPCNADCSAPGTGAPC